MAELVFEAGPEAREEFEQFLREHPTQALIESSSGSDGVALIHLIIENAPALAASIALLVGTLQRRQIRWSASRDGVELAITDLTKPS